MFTLTTIRLHWQADSGALFERLRDLSGSVFIDSARPHSEQGRYDLLTALPLQRFEVPQERLEATGLEQVLREIMSEADARLPLIESTGLPFCGGLIGQISYDAGLPEQGLDAGTAPTALPPISFGLYSWVILVDHERRETTLQSGPETPPEILEQILERLSGDIPACNRPFRLLAPVKSGMDREQYGQAFRRVQEYILAGDCYQVNLARAFTAPFEGDAWQAYRLLRPVAAAPFSAFIDSGNSQILSFSPERFIQAEGRRLLTEPIKGTAPRSPVPARDAELAQELTGSLKNRAENLMIVDLLRNDFGRVCEPGSIRVDALCELQSFNTVHHLVSRVRGTLAATKDLPDLVAACFPGGSITGAPKKRAMEIIRELEPVPRSLYCGSVMLVSRDGRLDSNIAIRSLLCSAGQLQAWAGGGIVADSDESSEFEETQNKIGPLLEALPCV